MVEYDIRVKVNRWVNLISRYKQIVVEYNIRVNKNRYIIVISKYKELDGFLKFTKV